MRRRSWCTRGRGTGSSTHLLTACPASCDETPHLLPDTPALGVMSAGQYTFHFGTNENLPNRPSPVTTTAPSKVPALIQTRLEQITKQDGRVEQSTTLLAVAGRRERTAMDRKAKATSMND